MAEYSQILPLRTDTKVADQFGWLPLSIYRPTKESKIKWKNAYLNDGLDEQRRSDTSEYLPGYTFSEFHAGLAENILKFWSLKGSKIVDPFAGRVTRAYVSKQLGRDYTGFEISPRTYERIHNHFTGLGMETPVINGDGTLMEEIDNNYADLIFTCPPYFNLEKYESVPSQLSDEPTYELFMSKIDTCIGNCFRVLKTGAFACWVVGDMRVGRRYLNFHGDVINSFKKHGFLQHDIVILENISPFAALQIGKTAANRYTSKIHEYLLVFRKPGEYDIPKYTSADELEQETKLQQFFNYVEG